MIFIFLIIKITTKAIKNLIFTNLAKIDFLIYKIFKLFITKDLA
jgi:hypothetical protein